MLQTPATPFVVEKVLGKWDQLLNWLLAFSLCASSCTSFRSRGTVGVGEMPLILWFALAVGTAIFYAKKQQFPIRAGGYFALFILLSDIALLLGLSKGHGEVGSTSWRGLLAYNYALLGPALFLILPSLNRRMAHLRHAWCWSGGTFFLILWSAYQVLPMFRKRLLFYNYRFSGLCLNPNQTALFLLLLPVLISQTPKTSRPRTAIICGLIWIGFATGSDALILSWLVLALCQILYRVWRAPSRSTITTFGTCFLLITIIWASKPSSVRAPSDFLTTVGPGENISTRWTLASNGLRALSDSWLVGWGPGAFSGEKSPFQNFEAHNSFIDWATNTGVMGLTLYTLLLYWIAKTIHRSSLKSLWMMLPLLLFSSFHFTFRHPFYWFSLLLCGETAIPSSPRSPSSPEE